MLSNGTLPAVSKEEFNARLQHLLHVLEITCLESNLQEFSSNSFKIAKEYSNKILRDIEEGYKSWETLDKCIDSTAWNFAVRMAAWFQQCLKVSLSLVRVKVVKEIQIHLKNLYNMEYLEEW